jgi:exonuclease SbcD
MPGEVLLAMGHCYMSGTRISELSERKILGGNQHALPVEVFPDCLDYVALGHLHLAQAVDPAERVRYSGSPIPLSLREAGYEHQVLLAAFDEGELQWVHSLHVPRAVEVVRLPEEGDADLDEMIALLKARFPEVVDEAGVADDSTWPWLEVRVRIDQAEPRIRARVEEAVAGRAVRLVKIDVRTAGLGGTLADWRQRRQLADMRPEQVFSECYERQFGSKPDPATMTAFHELVVGVEAE